MAARPLPNKALWGFEDVYKRLATIDRLLEQAASAGTDAQRRLLISHARMAAAEGRIQILKIHPGADK